MAESTTTAPRRTTHPLSVWELPASLLIPPHQFRKRSRKRGRERSHFPAILAFIYRNRFATASQVQRRFVHFLKSARTARRHLAEMQETLGYLDLIATPSPLWPKVYGLSRRGLKKLETTFQAKGQAWRASVEDRKRKNGFSIHHVIHELFISEFLLAVWQTAQDQPQIELLSLQRRALARHPAFRMESARLIPDGMCLLKHRERGQVCTFIELDTGSMSLAQLREKLNRYDKWAASESCRNFLVDLYQRHGSTQPRPVFRLMILCGGYRSSDPCQRVQRVRECLQDCSSQLKQRCWITTTTQLLQWRMQSSLISPIWQRIQADDGKWIEKQVFLELVSLAGRTAK